MKNIVLFFIVLVFLYASIASMYKEKYDRYQSFDEYKMEGIEVPNLKSPFILMEKDDKTIHIKFSEGKYNDIQYVNRGEYWHSISKNNLENCNQGYTPITEFYEKFIYNDTILIYCFKIEDSHEAIEKNIFKIKSDDYLIVRTRCTEVNIFYDESIRISFEESSRFEELKSLAKNYRNSFTDQKIIGVYQPKQYKYYNKIESNDTLYIYEKNSKDNYVYGCISDVRLLNSLGEFDIQRGKSLIGSIRIENRCQ